MLNQSESEGRKVSPKCIIQVEKTVVNQDKRSGSNEKKEGKHRGMKTYLTAISFYI